MENLYIFDLAALLLTGLIIIIYAVNRAYPTRARNVLFGLMCSTIIASILDMVSAATISGDAVPVAINYVLKSSFLLFDNLCVQFFYFYVLAISNGGAYRKISAKANRIIGLVAISLIALLLVTTPFTKFIYYFDGRTYVRSFLYPSLYAISFVSIFYSMIVLVHARAYLNKWQIASIVAFLVVVIGAMVLQFCLPSLRINLFACSLGIVLIFLSLERPSDFMYRNTLCYNKNAFYEYVREHKDEKFYAVITTPNNADYLDRTLSDETRNTTINAVISDLHSQFGKNNVFHLDGMSFVVIAKDDPLETVVKKSARKKSGSDPVESDFQFCIMSFPDLASDLAKLREAIDLEIHNPSQTTENVRWITTEELFKIDREILVLNAIRKALRNKTFQVYYQPILDTKSGSFVSAEALIRLNDKDLGFIPPDEFIPIAEQHGLIISIGEFVFDKVCDFWCKNNLDDLGVSFIEVNLSALQCVQKNLSTKLLTIMRKHGISTKHINLEITETAAAANHNVMIGNMLSLIGQGAAFSLDDYGTGYSNISYLSSLPVEIVKIDKSILWNAMKDEHSRIILLHTLKMVHDLGMKTVAEGVETKEMADLLRSVGCDYFQGFLFSRPIPEEEYLAFLRDHYSLI